MNYKAVEVIWIFLADERTKVFQEVLADLKISFLKLSVNSGELSAS